MKGMITRFIRGVAPLALVVTIALLLGGSGASAQFNDGGGGGGNGGGGSTPNVPNSAGGTARGNVNGSYYDYTTGSTLPIDINVWGFVASPGKYRVPSSTKLIQMISFAGGPTDRARLSDIRILHDLTIDSTIVEPVVILNLEEYQKSGDPSLNPILYPNDTIIVPGDALNVFREVLGIIRDVALVLGTLIALFVTIKR